MLRFYTYSREISTQMLVSARGCSDVWKMIGDKKECETCGVYIRFSREFKFSLQNIFSQFCIWRQIKYTVCISGLRIPQTDLFTQFPFFLLIYFIQYVLSEYLPIRNTFALMFEKGDTQCLHLYANVCLASGRS